MEDTRPPPLSPVGRVDGSPARLRRACLDVVVGLVTRGVFSACVSGFGVTSPSVTARPPGRRGPQVAEPQPRAAGTTTRGLPAGVCRGRFGCPAIRRGGLSPSGRPPRRGAAVAGAAPGRRSLHRAGEGTLGSRASSVCPLRRDSMRPPTCPCHGSPGRTAGSPPWQRRGTSGRGVGAGVGCVAHGHLPPASPPWHCTHTGPLRSVTLADARQARRGPRTCRRAMPPCRLPPRQRVT